MPNEDLRAALRAGIDRLLPAARTLLVATAGTPAQHSPVRDLVAAALEEQRRRPSAGALLALVAATDQFVRDAEDAGLGATPAHAACDMAVEEMQAAMGIARRRLAAS